MADVESQLEANGLPTSFESSSNAPEVVHATTNAAATISNSEISQLKEQAPQLEVSTTTKSAQPVEKPAHHSSKPDTNGNDVDLPDAPPNTTHVQPDDEVKTNGHSPDPVVIQTEPEADTSFADSGLPGSAPSTLSSDNTLDKSTTDVQMIDPIPEATPVSDLRTLSHLDALPAETVAKRANEKRDTDSNADMHDVAAPSTESERDIVPVTQESSLALPQSSTSAAEPAQSEIEKPQDDAIIESVETKDKPALGDQPFEPTALSVPPVIEPRDQEMTDVPAPAPVPTLPQATKLVRERDEDIAEEPSAKRLKTEEPSAESADFKIPASPAPVAQPSQSSTAAPTSADDAVTSLRLAHMKKVISNLKKSNASQAFRTPVDHVALKIPTYPDIVKRPMDLGTVDAHLKHNDYKSVQAFRNDFHQIVQNCVAFNGPDHQITQSAKKMETSFTNQMAHLPPISISEPPRVEKKLTKPKIEPVKQIAPPRRQSIPTKPASPKAPSPTTFAVAPNGMPLIRRDSTLDGRPKRAIVPPKRNSDFGGARPKKKKYELELRFSDEVLKIISSPKHWQANQYFTHPVDPVALNIPTYFQVIKKPMDLGTVRQKLDGGMYEKAKDFEEDVRMIFKNCFKFNPEGDYVYSRGQELERLFSSEWTKKADWIAAREPDSEPASVGGDDDDDDSEEEDAAAESEEEDQTDQLKALEAQLEAIKNQMGQLTQKKKKPSPGVSKKSNKKKVKKEQPMNRFPGLQKDSKSSKKSSKKAKPEKDRYVTFAEKQYISGGIAMLPERPMAEALKIIQDSVPKVANSDQGEIELDIEDVPNYALVKLLAFVKKYAGPPPDEPQEPEYAVPSVSKSKKSKSMSKQDQEAQIAELKGTLHHYNEAGSPDALQSIETGAEDSDDDDSNEESEEE